MTVSEYDFLSGTITLTPSSISTITYNGVFMGSTVVGVHYKAELNGLVKEGETDAEGKFQYFSDGVAFSPVTFSVGGVVLGTVTPSQTTGAYLMSVHDLVSASDVDVESKATNIQRFLSTINTSTDSAVLLVSAAVRAALANESVRLHELPLTGFDAKAQTLVNTLIAAGPLASGTVLATAGSVSAHLRETKSQIDAARIQKLVIETGADTVLADGKTRVVVQLKATGLDGKALVGGLVHLETTAGTFGSESNLCQESPSVTQTVDKITDSKGMAFVMLTPRCQTGNAVVSASLGGVIAMKTIQFIPGPATVGNSTITVNPKTLPADGKSKATVTLSLRDANNNPVKDQTAVTLQTTSGSIEGGSVGTTLSGRVTFSLLAPQTSGEATLTVSEYGFLTETVTMGVVSSTGGKPNSIQMSSGLQHIFVRGVGKTENVGIAIQVRDDVGDPLNEAALNYPVGFNNLRVTLKTRPQGGETIAGIGRKADAVSSGDVETKKSSETSNEILVRTTNGSATITLTSGVRPGLVEFQVDALDANGTTRLASAVSPLVSIASGPPHTIALTEAYKEGIVNLKDYGRGGVYCRQGSVLVTDRYGNAVPDGTTVALGLIDAVLATSTTGSISVDSEYLTDANVAFEQAGVDQSGLTRRIQAGDLVLIERGVEAQDRRRFVLSRPTSAASTRLQTNANYRVNSANVTTTDADYQTSITDLTYYVGASLRGGAIHGYAGQQGCDPAQLTTGVASTTGGVAALRVTYPANPDVIQLGCFGYVNGVYSDTDTRFPNRSGQVMLLASSNETNDVNESGATLISKGRFCYLPVSPATLTPLPTSLGKNSTSFEIVLHDEGQVRVPFVEVECSAVETSDISQTLNIQIATPVKKMTDLNGTAAFDVTITGGGGATPDTGTITCNSKSSTISGTVTIGVSVP
ncbi:MAG: hypothetical protein HQL99_06575 [Magnetococcales bacterium]|nr:hypothetical protein [Magnetococcales bacterium]